MERIYGNGIIFKIAQNDDGWWSVWEEHPITHELIPVIQAKDKAHALSYIRLCERPNVPFNIL